MEKDRKRHKNKNVNFREDTTKKVNENGGRGEGRIY